MLLTWKTIPGYSDYEISNLGTIRSVERIKRYKSGRVISLKSKEKKLRVHPVNGFLMTDLVNDEGKRSTVYPHKAVAQAFIPNKRPKKQKIVIHIDGDYSNNSIENLRWSTYSESFKISFQTGKRDNSQLWEKRRAKYGPKGGNKSMGRPDPLSDACKEEIIRLRKEEGITLKRLASQFQCSISHIHKTIRQYEEPLLVLQDAEELLIAVD